MEKITLEQMAAQTQVYVAFDDSSLSSSKMKKYGLGTYNNRNILKEMGFNFGKLGKTWAVDHNCTSDQIKKLKDLGIIIEKPICIGEKTTFGDYIANVYPFSHFKLTACFLIKDHSTWENIPIVQIA